MTTLEAAPGQQAQHRLLRLLAFTQIQHLHNTYNAMGSPWQALEA